MACDRLGSLVQSVATRTTVLWLAGLAIVASCAPCDKERLLAGESTIRDGGDTITINASFALSESSKGTQSFGLTLTATRAADISGVLAHITRVRLRGATDTTVTYFDGTRDDAASHVFASYVLPYDLIGAEGVRVVLETSIEGLTLLPIVIKARIVGPWASVSCSMHS